ncbi:unnamed protein product [Effrenium voratum]|nr:unnamed protein product [Effrenium voratum]|eukprot:CAMPEP_0181457764 /NCGR_PEP_ID=MMETSP1110-20121109/31956_1 /TAXON_ID=174948 /ORGANISM="Symbiodinium sp., Strain CCMP421" /LENGTH=467 /DNA_ID=CAMNT_0023582219 /DNA_START=67 /DNA_END=1470 /DNA_ORIENTATION=-
MTSVQMPAPREQREQRGTVRPAKLFIGGLSRNTTTKHLRDHFSRYGRILDCVAMRQPDGRPRGFGYVTLDSPGAADRCLAEPQYVDGRQLDMKHAVPEGAGEMPTARLHPGKGKVRDSIPSPVSMALGFDFSPMGSWPWAQADCLDLLGLTATPKATPKATPAAPGPLSANSSVFVPSQEKGKSRPALGNITNVINLQDGSNAKPLKAGPVDTSAPALDSENPAFVRERKSEQRKGLQIFIDEDSMDPIKIEADWTAPVSDEPKKLGVEPPSDFEDDMPDVKFDIADLPSKGSIEHASGNCKRCNFFPKGRCQNGKNCTFCHLPHPKRKPTRAAKWDREEAWLAEQDSSNDEEDCLSLPPPPGLAPPPGLSLTCHKEISSALGSRLLSTTPQVLAPLSMALAPVGMRALLATSPSVATPMATPKNTVTIATQTSASEDSASSEISREDLLRLRSAGGEPGLKTMALP